MSAAAGAENADLLISYTLFPNVWPTEKTERADVPWPEFVAKIRETPTYIDKAHCPLVSLCEYGELLSTGQNPILRHADNVKRVFGAEFDYDGGEIAIERAADSLQAAGILSVLYTSPSHTPLKPRWRALLPFSEPALPERRVDYVGRANRVLGGAASRESFTLSQSFYIGRVRGAEYVVLETGGRCIDLAADIEPLYFKGYARQGAYVRDETTDAQLRASFEQGEGRYEAMQKLSARWAAKGMAADDIYQTLVELLGNNPFNADGIDLRVRARALADSGVEKYGETRRRRTPVPAADPKPIAKQNGSTHVEVGADEPVGVSWADMGLDCNAGKVPYPSLGNVALILENHPEVKGTIWLDTFRNRIFHSRGGKPKEWTDGDDIDLTRWINQALKLPKIGVQTVTNAVIATARSHQKNSLTDWLDSLKWDGAFRLSMWLTECMGVAATEYTRAIGRNWIISMIARAYRPGCQVDTMPVLEGKMGKGKSKALETLGGEFYASLTEAFGSKDFLQAIQGNWLIEIPDLAGFSKREHGIIIATITVRVDRYRASYGRHTQDHPRTCVFAATSERDDYLLDDRGVRRYWPLRCEKIDLEKLAGMREQLFAEALQAYAEGETWHVVPVEETAAEQADRQQSDPWEEAVLQYCGSRKYVRTSDVLRDCLDIKIGDQDRALEMRVAKILRAAGYLKEKGRKAGGNGVYWFHPQQTGGDLGGLLHK